ncbi:MAG: Uma2 family endonuclease [Caldilineaceae bacterium]
MSLYEDTLVLPTEEEEFEEFADMGSFNHGYTQTRLIVLLDKLENYTPITELSLDIRGVDLSKFDLRTKEEIKPDICLYPKRGRSQPRDILRMKEMPLLAIEILSPKQGSYDILEKFKVYFELGVTSCWLVDPAVRTITVYAATDEWETFSGQEVIDEPLGIRLPLNEVFD